MYAITEDGAFLYGGCLFFENTYKSRRDGALFITYGSTKIQNDTYKKICDMKIILEDF